ncbi:hypothetical protein [Oerskovia flava]|uniref:hypothetical protein n=1 Tax=Oerskovia flava TaxID=2986422 RepID=UPI00223E9396|nr:hypothetical protein [Oerskovia sp. JB1-3-2]
MRWEELFDDLESQVAAAHAEERAAQVADLTRAELSTVTLVDRLRTAGTVGVHLLDGSQVNGQVRDVAATWVLVAEHRRQHLVPLHAVAAVDGPGHQALPGSSPRPDGPGLGHVLRALMRDRVVVQARTAAGVFTGRIARVGRDHLDLGSPGPSTYGASAPLGPGRGTTRLVPFAALLSVSET